ncbi:hypothetical protein V2J09_003639 [Rumex salicifolius]
MSMFFFFLLPLLIQYSSSALPNTEHTALLSLKSSLLDPLSSLRDWTPTAPHCAWSGVTCDNSTASAVVSLDLSARNLSGFIPLDLQCLTNLRHLNLSHNAFQGPFPAAAVFGLENLESLDVNHNSFNSTFPLGISKLRFLRVLNCYSNSFTGGLPEDLSPQFHRHLRIINLGGSYFEGPIPAGYGGFPRLQFLNLAGNVLNGSLPPQLGGLAELRRIEIGYNAALSGEIPPEFGQLLNLNYMDMSYSNLSGSIPSELGNLTSLDTLLLFNNRLSGSIPLTISKLKSLKILDLSDNQLVGEIPEGISELKELSIVSLLSNNLTGGIPEGIGDLPNLRYLQLWNNSLTGPLPAKLGLSGMLEKLDVSTNSLSGALPESLCKGNKLDKLMLFSNRFSDGLPSSLANCTTLNRVRMQGNFLSGAIPHGFGNIPNLTFLDLSRNNLTGQIPTDLGKSISLGTLNLSRNSFNSELPGNIWEAPNLQILSAFDSGIFGKLPDFDGCRSIYKIELAGNLLNGSIPWKIGHCEKLVSLDLSHNSLTGIIPWELSTLPAITDVDLSHNLLTGTIPANFDNCTTLEMFDVSYNLLRGPVPSSTGGTIANLQPSSFVGNAGLCGDLIERPCTAGMVVEEEKHIADGTTSAILWITAAAFGVGLFVLLAGIRWFQGSGDEKKPTSGSPGQWKMIAFQRLSFTAEEVVECMGISEEIIGMGSTGTVYKAEMRSGETIAVKKLWGKNHKVARSTRGGGGRDGVLAEVEVLGSVRHRNIVRLLGCCTNGDTTLLLYEYMPNGSLDDLLHGAHNHNSNKVHVAGGDWVTRFNIALGVAQGICYLHHDCHPIIVHRDLKPRNILLDPNMDARVADFGLAKLIHTHESMSVIAGSYGYIAPEYLHTLQVDEKSDIYSYGVVLLEILTGKRAVEPEFGEGNSIVDWVQMKIKLKDDGVDAVLDSNAGASCASVKEEMILVLRVALLCTSRNPADRPSMRDVVSMLHGAMPQRKLGGGGGADHVIEFKCGCGESMDTCEKDFDPAVGIGGGTVQLVFRSMDSKCQLVELIRISAIRICLSNLGFSEKWTRCVQFGGLSQKIASNRSEAEFVVAMDERDQRLPAMEATLIAPLLDHQVYQIRILNIKNYCNLVLSCIFPCCCCFSVVAEMAIELLTPWTTRARFSRSRVSPPCFKEQGFQGVGSELLSMIDARKKKTKREALFNGLEFFPPPRTTIFVRIIPRFKLGMNREVKKTSNDGLSGSLVPQLGQLSNLQYLEVYGNRLTGVIPMELGNLTRLISLDLQNNNLTGMIPSSLGLLSSLKWMRLNGNSFNGAIPGQIGNLTSLIELDLHLNAFSGSIPSSLGNLKSLAVMKLNGNSLTGEIPTNVLELICFGNALAGRTRRTKSARAKKFAVTKIIQDPVA